jgi:hypothetical protein
MEQIELDHRIHFLDSRTDFFDLLPEDRAQRRQRHHHRLLMIGQSGLLRSSSQGR